MEAIQVSINKWMDKDDMVYIDTMHYYSATKQWNFAICSNMDGHGGYYSKWYQSDTEREILYDTTYMWNLKNTKTNEYWKRNSSNLVQPAEI